MMPGKANSVSGMYFLTRTRFCPFIMPVLSALLHPEPDLIPVVFLTWAYNIPK